MPMPTTTLADLAQTALNYRSASTDVADTKSTTGLRPGITEADLPERCVLDEQLVGSLRSVVMEKLQGIKVSEGDVNEFMNIRKSLASMHLTVSMHGEEGVRRQLEQNWLRQAEWILARFVRTVDQQSSVRIQDVKQQQRHKPDLALSLEDERRDTEADWKVMALFKCQSEETTRTHSVDMVNVGRRQERLAYDDTLDRREMLVSKVASYLTTFDVEWLCWGSASRLIVFRLVKRASQRPYMAMSNIVRVPDLREEPGLDDGGDWLSCVVGCGLAGLSNVWGGTNATSVSNACELIPERGRRQDTDQGEPPTRGDTHENADCHKILLYVSKDEVPATIAISLEQRRRKFVAGTPPHNVNLRAVDPIGEGSTGLVYRGFLGSTPVAIKVAEETENRERMRKEAEWYAQLRESAQVRGLPTFLGWYEGTYLDVLVLSDEGDCIADWEALDVQRRHELVWLVYELHRAGVAHGDLEPRNILLTKSGQVRLVDLTEASAHVCRAIVKPGWAIPHRMCLELARLSHKLGIMPRHP